MLCEDCQRVFEAADLKTCPVCGSTNLQNIRKITCPVCGLEMKPGYISVPLRMDWRDKWVKSGEPIITVTDRSCDRGWLRRLSYYCDSCGSFFIYKAVKNNVKQEAGAKKSLLCLLCPECGSEIVEKVNFCPFCGFKFTSDDEKKISRVKFSL